MPPVDSGDRSEPERVRLGVLDFRLLTISTLLTKSVAEQTTPQLAAGCIIRLVKRLTGNECRSLHLRHKVIKFAACPPFGHIDRGVTGICNRRHCIRIAKCSVCALDAFENIYYCSSV